MTYRRLLQLRLFGDSNGILEDIKTQKKFDDDEIEEGENKCTIMNSIVQHSKFHCRKWSDEEKMMNIHYY